MLEINLIRDRVLDECWAIAGRLPPVLTEDARLFITISPSFEIIGASIVFAIGGGWDTFYLEDLTVIPPPSWENESEQS